MFTGLIEQQAKVLSCIQLPDAGLRLRIASSYDQWEIGESIAVNGVCLTALPVTASELQFDISPETSRLTTLAALQTGDSVNVERAMLATTRYGGHYVSGHVDTMAYIASITPLGEFVQLELAGFQSKECLYLVPKGSITVDGVSLTINQLHQQSIQIMLVPHTLQKTTLGSFKQGQKVNIEFDYLTRIVAHQLQISERLHHEVTL